MVAGCWSRSAGTSPQHWPRPSPSTASIWRSPGGTTTATSAASSPDAAEAPDGSTPPAARSCRASRHDHTTPIVQICSGALTSSVMSTKSFTTAWRMMAVSVCVVGVVACGGDDDSSSDASLSAAVETYADGVEASYQASLTSATAMDTAIEAFVAAPSDGDAARRPRTRGWPPATTTARPRRSASTAARSTTRRRARGPDQRLAARRGVHRLRRGRRRTPASSTTPTTYPTIDADVLTGAQREGRRDQHLHRLARDRVPAVGPGPQRHRTRRPPGRRTTRPTRTPTAGRRTSRRRPQLLVDHLSGARRRLGPRRTDNYRAEFLALDDRARR